MSLTPSLKSLTRSFIGSSSHDKSFVLILHEIIRLISSRLMWDVRSETIYHFVNVLIRNGRDRGQSRSFASIMPPSHLAWTTLQSSRMKSVI